MFIGTKYQEKEWCGLEFRAIKELILSKQLGRIMYVRIDDGEVEGVLKTDGYIDSRDHTPQEVAKLIAERTNITI